MYLLCLSYSPSFLGSRWACITNTILSLCIRAAVLYIHHESIENVIRNGYVVNAAALTHSTLSYVHDEHAVNLMNSALTIHVS